MHLFVSRIKNIILMGRNSSVQLMHFRMKMIEVVQEENALIAEKYPC